MLHVAEHYYCILQRNSTTYCKALVPHISEHLYIALILPVALNFPNKYNDIIKYTAILCYLTNKAILCYCLKL